jgi:site-specific DNA-adenine methylase
MHGFRPLSVFEHACNQTNYAVFQGAAPAVFSMKDAFEFMNTIEADTVYLDPPYYGATTYQSKYQALEDWFGEKSDPRCEAFNSNNLFEELVKASKRFHTIIISYGGSVTKKETLETTRKYRKDAKLIPLRHVYSCGVRPKKAGPVGNEILIACTGE